MDVTLIYFSQTGNLAVLSLHNTAFERWFGDLEPGEQIYSGA